MVYLHIRDRENLEFKKHMIVLQKAIINTFNKSDWKEFGYETGTEDFINRHPRLLRSLDWDDPDYNGCVLDALEYILNDNNLATLLKKEEIKNWIEQNTPEAYVDLYKNGTHVPAFVPQKVSPKDVVNSALKEAESSINIGNPENAIDRMHTAFHGYLKAICNENSIFYSQDPSITDLFKLIYTNLIKINHTTAHPQEIEKILRAHASSIHSINTLRNHASMAHVNDLLGKDEATLIVNTIRTLLHYIETKIR